MEIHDASAYGRSAADGYDALYADIPETAEAVSFLAELAGEGPVLELGIGTGRLALPLIERGLEVHGIEGSAEMAERLREKPGGEAIPVTVGDFSETVLPERFSLVVLAFNTIFAPVSQEAQVRTFECAARQLEPGGVFVVEAFVLSSLDLQRTDSVQPRFMSGDRVELQVVRHHPAEQRLEITNVHMGGDGLRLIPVTHRYASPAELDLMARIAGLSLRERHGGFGGEPFDGASTRHVSVYEKGVA